MAKRQLMMLTSMANKRCVGSSHGWLIMIDEDTPSIFAADPLHGSNRVELPSLLTFPAILDFDGDEYLYYSPALGCTNMSSSLINTTYIKKAFLSKDPTEEGCVAMVIFGELNQLALCKVGDEEWTVVEQQDEVQDEVHGYQDVVFDGEGWFYAVNFDGVIVNGNPSCSFLKSVYEPDERMLSDKKYLCFDTEGRLLLINRYIGWIDYDDDVEDEEEGEISPEHSLLIDRYIRWIGYDNVEVEEEEDETSDDQYCWDSFCYKTSTFRVFRLDEETGTMSEIDSLGDGVLYLGDNQSVCVSSMKYIGCKEDSIYFTDDNLSAHTEPRIGGHDLGVFSMKDGCIQKFQFWNGSQGIWPPPIWVTVPLYGPLD